MGIQVRRRLFSVVLECVFDEQTDAAPAVILDTFAGEMVLITGCGRVDSGAIILPWFETVRVFDNTGTIFIADVNFVTMFTGSYSFAVPVQLLTIAANTITVSTTASGLSPFLGLQRLSVQRIRI